MKKHTSRDFESFRRRIERAYKKLGHKNGWRFLYTPAKTLNSKSEIIFIGLNPGGGEYEPPKASVENGNAYRDGVEPWGKDRKLPNSLQFQVSALYDLLSSAWPGTKGSTLMDKSLSANFIPFRSGNRAGLKNPKDSLRFAKKLWEEILGLVAPKVIITMGKEVTHHLDELLESRSEIDIVDEPKCDWGKLRYRLAFSTLAGRRVLLIGLPHLSRFGIFSRKNYKRTFAPLVKAVKQHLKK